MKQLKDDIKELFLKELDKQYIDKDNLSISTLELKLNTIVENILDKIDINKSISIPIKQTSNENVLDGVEFNIEKSSEFELCDEFEFKSEEESIKQTTIPANFKLSYEMEQFAKSKFVQDVTSMFEDFKLYYQSKATLNSDWEAVWKRWVLNNNKFKNHIVKTTISEDMKLSSSMKEFAVKFIAKENLEIEFIKFKNHYLSNGDIKVSWEKVWENWCINHKQFKPKEQSAKAKEKADYKWDFKKAKDSSDRIKDWLEFEKGINWLEDFYLKDIPLPGIGWQEVQHPDFNKEEILLYKIDSDNGQYMIERKSDDIIEVEVLNND